MNYRLLAAATAASLAFVAGPAMADHTPAGSAVSIPEPPAGKGQIVFFRPSGMGMAMGCTVREGETKISSVGNGKYVVVVAEPGAHEYTVHSEAKDVLALQVEPDETQFVRCRIKMGIMAGRPDIAPSTPDEFTGASKKLKPVDDDDMGEGARRSTDLASAH